MVYLGKTKNPLLHLGAIESTFKNALALRKKQTPAELILWKRIRNRQIMNAKFRRQHPIHMYVADFYCHEYKLVIEIDGKIHDLEEHKTNDENRSAELERLGIHVIRFSNEEVLNYIDKVLEAINDKIKELRSKVL